MTAIGNYAFSGCSGFTGNLTISNSIAAIGSNVFRNCSGFTGDLIIPNSVIRIYSEAFSGCSGVNSVTIPDQVRAISYGAFADCTNLISMTVMATTPPELVTYEYETWVWDSLGPNLVVIYVPVQSVDLYREADGWSLYQDIIVGI